MVEELILASYDYLIANPEVADACNDFCWGATSSEMK